MIPIRDHYRPGIFPIINDLLIMINFAVFFYTIALGPSQLDNFIGKYALVPASFSWLSLITSQFIHGGLLHILGNMLFLHIFGDNLEDRMGHLPYLIFYLLCGMAAGLTQYLLSQNSPIPVIGASGAIAGTMGGYLVAFPRSRIDVIIPLFIIFPIITIPAYAILLYWIGTQALLGSVPTGVDAGGVAYSAHLGGFVAGAILVNIFPVRQGFNPLRSTLP